MGNKNLEEVEIKLALSDEAISTLLNHPLLSRLPFTQQSLRNTYFDTPEGSLANARIALRLRQIDGNVLQTVKTAGQGSGGLSQRQEWEWPVADQRLDTTTLMTLPPFEGALGNVVGSLAPTLSTHFTRRSWQLIDPWPLNDSGLLSDDIKPGSHIELVVDEGDIISGDFRTPIREIELELKSGEPEALWALAITLADKVPLRPSDSSKATRGNALSAQHWPLPDAHSPAEWLHRATLALDAYHDSHQTSFFTDAQQSLAILAEHPALDNVERPLAQALAGGLDANGQPSIAYGKAALVLAQRFSYQTTLR